jgi:hypothetical protein
VQPVPITATRLPATSASAGQRDVCHDDPRKSAIPSISGTRGRLRKPTAVITAFARSVRSPAGPSIETSHSPAASSQRSARTSVSKTMSSRTSKVSATQSK